MRATRKTSRRTETRKGNCVYTTAELLEENVLGPDVRLDTLFWPEGGFRSWYHNFGHVIATRVKQRGNGSIRLVYLIPKWYGGGKATPFTLPSGSRIQHTSYPLDANGVDPRDREASQATRRAFGLTAKDGIVIA